MNGGRPARTLGPAATRLARSVGPCPACASRAIRYRNTWRLALDQGVLANATHAASGQKAQQSTGTATQPQLCPRCVQHPVDKRGDKRRKPRQLRPLTGCLENGQPEGLAEPRNRSPLPTHGDTLKGHRKRGQSEPARCRVAPAGRWDESRGPTQTCPVARNADSPSREALHSPRRNRPGFLRDEAQGANSSRSLDGSPEFAGKRIARKTKVRNGPAQTG